MTLVVTVLEAAVAVAGCGRLAIEPVGVLPAQHDNIRERTDTRAEASESATMTSNN